jgi:hypothetical protein
MIGFGLGRGISSSVVSTFGIEEEPAGSQPAHAGRDRPEHRRDRHGSTASAPCNDLLHQADQLVNAAMNSPKVAIVIEQLAAKLDTLPTVAARYRCPKVRRSGEKQPLENAFGMPSIHEGAEIDAANSPQYCLSPGVQGRWRTVLEKALAVRVRFERTLRLDLL